jgi:hypothetical protein
VNAIKIVVTDNPFMCGLLPAGISGFKLVATGG